MNRVEQAVIHISFCYYVYDTIAGIYYQFNDFWMTVHHILIFMAYFHSLYYSGIASEMFTTMFVSELTNPFLIIMKTSQYEEKTQLSIIMGACFAFSYPYLRGYVGYRVARRVLLSNTEMVMKVACSLMRKVLLPSVCQLLLDISNRSTGLIERKRSVRDEQGSR